MSELLIAAAAQNGGYLFRSTILDCGFRDRDIRAMMRSGLLERLRHGTYAFVDDLKPLSPEARSLLVAYSIIDKLGPGVAFSHHTASIAHTGVSYGVDLSTIHLTKLDGRHGRREAGVEFHVGRVVSDDDLCEVNGRLCVKPARAAVESCSISSIESGMVAASFAIRSGGCTREEIVEAMNGMQRWPRMAHVRLAVIKAEPRCESVGEVRSLFMFSVERIPRPQLQFCVRRDGMVVARVDFGWIEQRHVGEFDGKIKYGKLNPDPQNPGAVLFDEKKREDIVRGQRFGMSRWTWGDMDRSRRAATGQRIRTDIERSERLYARNAVHIPLSR